MKTSFKLNPKDASLLFWNENDVLKSEDARVLRDHDLRRGLILGNSYQEETGIIYYSKDGTSTRINGRITALTEKNVILEDHSTIPINHIHDVIV